MRYAFKEEKEEKTDLIETAKMLDELMDSYDPYGYMDAEYSVEQALYDLENDPYMVVQELIKIIKNDIIEA